MHKTKKELANYIHIVSDKILTVNKAHPLENKRSKLTFVKFLLDDMKIDSKDCEDISNGKNSLFRIYFDNYYFNIFIEFTDGGGADVSRGKASKKISIPFNNPYFKDLIKNNQNVLVLNVYIPLNENYEADISKRVYMFINPNEIYASKCVREGTWNASSRWFELGDVLEVIHTKNIK